MQKKKLKEIRSLLTKHEIPHNLKLGKGQPQDVIIEEAKEKNTDLLVVGRRGMGQVKRILLGSVSDYCVKNAPCPVMVVHNKEIPSWN